MESEDDVAKVMQELNGTLRPICSEFAQGSEDEENEDDTWNRFCSSVDARACGFGERRAITVLVRTAE